MKNLFYIADPMCSWCWGFAPSIVEILKRFKEKCSIHLLMGGLRTGEKAGPVGGSLRRHLEKTWAKVEEASGQAISRAILDVPELVYDTEPACRAVVAVRGLRPELEVLYFHRLQDAFYRQARDITNVEVLADLARISGLDPLVFRMAFERADTARAVQGEFGRVRALGVEGFPCLLLESRPGEFSMVSQGWRDPASVVNQLERLL